MRKHKTVVGKKGSCNPRHLRRNKQNVRESMVGSHVPRGGQAPRHGAQQGTPTYAQARKNVRSARRAGAYAPVEVIADDSLSRRPSTSNRAYIDGIRRRARIRRILTGVVAVVFVVGVALVAGAFAFRGAVGSDMALRDSDANEALVAARADGPSYTLIATELGEVASPLEKEGPDSLLLCRVDPQSQSLAIIAMPPSLQVTSENQSVRIAETALSGDAALIQAVEKFAKVDVSHYVKVDEAGLQSIVDTLGGVDVEIEQVIDDPHAGDLYFPVGEYTLNGVSVLPYLRATNLKLGIQDQLSHQLTFASLLIEKLFCSEGAFAPRLESIDTFFQTDYSLGDIEGIASWLSDKGADAIKRTALPGYLASATNVSDEGPERFIGSSDDMAAIIAALDSGSEPAATSLDEVNAVDPGSFTVEVQNGTVIAGAAGATAESLTSLGFDVGEVGNADQPIYDETLVVYKDGDEGLARAKTVINALGIGRAVVDTYYTFDADVLLIIGADYKPMA